MAVLPKRRVENAGAGGRSKKGAEEAAPGPGKSNKIRPLFVIFYKGSDDDAGANRRFLTTKNRCEFPNMNKKCSEFTIS